MSFAAFLVGKSRSKFVLLGSSRSSSNSMASALSSSSSRTFSRSSSSSSSSTVTAAPTFPLIPPNTSPNAPLHLVVLVHGWMGKPNELSYLHQALERQAAAVAAAAANSNNEEDDEQDDANHHDNKPLVLVHSATANDGQTSDGIAAGGSRLAAEINDWIEALASSRENNSSISLSLIGNSLGGLYARYALSEIHWNNDSNNAQQQQQQHPKIRPAVFVTTATPHLGVAAPHTYLNLPRWAEYGIAKAMQQTGMDLFRFTSTSKNEEDDKDGVDVIQKMTTDERFVRPLANFERRIAYANAHNTDFQVPCSTAAFLSRTTVGDDDSNRRYRVVHSTASKVGDASGGSGTGGDGPLPHVALTVTTERRDWETETCSSSLVPLSSDELAVRLDALGWTKVFCDVRNHLFPLMTLPSFGGNGDAAGSSDEAEADEAEAAERIAGTMENSSSNNNDKKKEYYTSSELWDTYATFWPSDRRLHAPLGHQVLVANAKNEFFARMTTGGQAIMEELAGDIVQGIFQQQPQTASARDNDDNVE